MPAHGGDRWDRDDLPADPEDGALARPVDTGTIVVMGIIAVLIVAATLIWYLSGGAAATGPDTTTPFLSPYDSTGYPYPGP